MKERRQHPRFALGIEVDVDSGHNFFTGETRDLSASGLVIAADVPLPVGDSVSVKLALGGHKFSVPCQVMWTMADAEGKSLGIGCRFERLSQAQRDAIQAFMKDRAPMDFEVQADDDTFDRPPERPSRKR